jgi:hypothetical protein
MFRKQPEPVGMALANCYSHVGALFAQWQALVRQVGSTNRIRMKCDLKETAHV